MNPCSLHQAALDVDEADSIDLTPLVSGNTPIVTVLSSEDEDVAEDVVEDSDEDIYKYIT